MCVESESRMDSYWADTCQEGKSPADTGRVDIGPVLRVASRDKQDYDHQRFQRPLKTDTEGQSGTEN